mmetsp:Transcript_32656/g.53316  ORF Transcript_32656/g.53316 Transcript_32656/m.53316 type:complete len:96 (-) Transcript_32656:35-322(-)
MRGGSTNTSVTSAQPSTVQGSTTSRLWGVAVRLVHPTHFTSAIVVLSGQKRWHHRLPTPQQQDWTQTRPSPARQSMRAVGQQCLRTSEEAAPGQG